MGVPGLWDVLRPASKVRSLTELAVVEGFDANTNGMRGFRVGIDASIWFFHANWGKEGENPELRTLFFRCATLLSSPFLPLFVFDGPKRPAFKRGKRINTSSHKLTNGMKSIIEAFGFEWRTAPGEAEAELAYLNRIGVIDAVLTDDVDTFLFGATMVIRNSSNTLSGNKANPVLNSDGRDDKNHSAIYHLNDINTHPSVGLDRGGLILIGLMRGGDYHQAGVAGCGPTIAYGLARCGFGETLYQAAINLPADTLPGFLAHWRAELCHELRTDSQGHLGKKYNALSKKIPNNFPNLEVLESYVNPITSEKMGRSIEANRPTWTKEPDLGRLAETCELFFEWGFKEMIVKRFRTVIWPSVVLRILRRSVLDSEARTNGTMAPCTPRKKKSNATSTAAMGTPSKLITKHFSSMKIVDEDDTDEEDDTNLVIKIHSTRQHASRDKMLEYRLEIAPAHLVRLTEAGVKGIRRPEDKDEWASEDGEDEEDDEEDGARKKKGVKKPPPLPDSHLRVWMPASVVRLAEPGLVEEFEEVQRKKAEKKTRKTKGATASKDKATKSTSKASTTSRSTAKGRGMGKKAVALEEEEEEEEIFLDLEALREEEEEDEEDALPVHVPVPKARAISGALRPASAAQTSTTMKSFFAVQKPILSGSLVKESSAKAPSGLSGSRVSREEEEEEGVPIIDLTARGPRATRLPSKSKSSSQSTSASARTLQLSQSSYMYASDEDDQDERPLRDQPPPKLKFTSTPKSSPSKKLNSPQPTSTPSSTSATAVPSCDLTPRKFPLDDFPDFFSRPASHSPSPPPVTSPSRRKKATLSSSEDYSDSSPSKLLKSPRKSAHHTSPRSKDPRTPSRAQESFSVERPGSPSPFRPPPPAKTVHGSTTTTLAHIKSHHRPIDIINLISSDSEPDVDLTKVPPLLAAKAKVTKANAKAKASKAKLGDNQKRKAIPAKTKMISTDLIDLT